MFFFFVFLVIVMWLIGKHNESMAFLMGYERGWSSKQYDPENAYIDYLKGEW